MTISQHISIVRSLLRAFTDDSLYSDEFLYALLNARRAQVIKEGALINKNISHFNWQVACMPLILSTIHDDCPCVDIDDCQILRTKFKIPKPISVNGKPLLKVRTFDGATIAHMSLDKIIQKHNYKHLAKKLAYTVSNGYLFIYGTNLLKAVIIDGIFEDPLQLAGVTMCDVEGNGLGPCFDPNTEEYPLDLFIEPAVRTLVIQDILGPKTEQDDINDSKSTQ
jgi:hypothetical protein